MRRAILPLLGVLVAMVAIVLVSYVTAYLARSELVPVRVAFKSQPTPDFLRIYQTRLEVAVFKPAAAVESSLCRKWVKPAIEPLVE
jgi:hypothetical protein